MDICIDNSHIVMSNGDFVFIDDSVREVKQHIIVALNTFLGDWVLNSLKGINYPAGLRENDLLEVDVKKQLLGVKNVRAIDNFKLIFSNDNKSVSVSATVFTTFGNILKLSETVNSYY